jgi:hypothetical protein
LWQIVATRLARRFCALLASLTINGEYNLLSGLLGTEATLPDGTSPHLGDTYPVLFWSGF